jgi:hypothetical protein
LEADFVHPVNDHIVMKAASNSLSSLAPNVARHNLHFSRFEIGHGRIGRID